MGEEREKWVRVEAGKKGGLKEKEEDTRKEAVERLEAMKEIQIGKLEKDGIVRRKRGGRKKLSPEDNRGKIGESQSRDEKIQSEKVWEESRREHDTQENGIDSSGKM